MKKHNKKYTTKPQAVRGGRGPSEAFLDAQSIFEIVRGSCEYKTRFGDFSLGLESVKLQKPGVFCTLDFNRSSRVGSKSSKANSFHIGTSITFMTNDYRYSTPPKLFCGSTLKLTASASRNMTNGVTKAKFFVRPHNYALVKTLEHGIVGGEIYTQMGLKWQGKTIGNITSTAFVKTDIGFTANWDGAQNTEGFNFERVLRNKLIKLSKLAYNNNEQILPDFIVKAASSSTKTDLNSAAEELMAYANTYVTKFPADFTSLYANELNDFSYAKRFVEGVIRSQRILTTYREELELGIRDVGNVAEQKRIIDSAVATINHSLALGTGRLRYNTASDVLGPAITRSTLRNNLNKNCFGSTDYEPIFSKGSVLVRKQINVKLVNTLKKKWVLVKMEKQASTEKTAESTQTTAESTQKTAESTQKTVLRVASIAAGPPPLRTIGVTSGVCVLMLLGYKLLSFLRKKKR